MCQGSSWGGSQEIAQEMIMTHVGGLGWMKIIRTLVILQKSRIISWLCQVWFSYAVVLCSHAFMPNQKKSAGMTRQPLSAMRVSLSFVQSFSQVYSCCLPPHFLVNTKYFHCLLKGGFSLNTPNNSCLWQGPTEVRVRDIELRIFKSFAWLACPYYMRVFLY